MRVGITRTSDDARLPWQFVIMAGTADRVRTTRNDSYGAGVKPCISTWTARSNFRNTDDGIVCT